MGSLSSNNGGIRYLFCVIGVSNEYAWVTPLVNEKARTVLHGFNEILNESKRKPNK